MSDEDVPPPDIANHPVVRELKALEPVLTDELASPEEKMRALGLLHFVDSWIKRRYHRPNPLRGELDQEKRLREDFERKSENRRLLLFVCSIVILFLVIARIFHF